MVEQSDRDQPKLTVKAEAAADGVAVLCPCGRVDGSTIGILEAAVQEQMEAGSKVLIFDFGETAYISSAGLRVLLLSARNMQSGGGRAMFCALSAHIAQVFEISGFSEILDIHSSRDEALAAV